MTCTRSRTITINQAEEDIGMKAGTSQRQQNQQYRSSSSNESIEVPVNRLPTSLIQLISFNTEARFTGM